MRLFVLGTMCALLLSGCAQQHFVGRPDLTFMQQQDLPAPTREDYALAPRPYVIGPSDELRINVFGIPELSGDIRVDSAGQIGLPLVGRLSVSGRTAGEVTDMIAASLRTAYVRDPSVTVNVVNAANEVVTVDGQVGTPGIYPIQGRISLMRAVARAGGLTEFARQEYVVVYRHAQGREYAALYDLRAIRAGAYPDPDVYANDIVFVGESHARRIFKDVLSTAPLLSAPLVALLR